MAVESLDGTIGDDTIESRVGDDTMTGGAGADVFVFSPDHGTDTITDFTDGEDRIDLSRFSSISDFSDLTITADGDDVVIDLTAHGGGTIRLEGVDLANLDASDFLFRVNQWIEGDEGDNTLTGDTGDDTLLGHEGTDTIYGGAGNDGLWGHAGDDTLYGGEGDDALYGDAVRDPADTGDDTLYGGAGNDAMWGHAGDDTLYGGEGDDRLYGDAARDGEYQGVYTGDDTIYGAAGDDTIYGGAGNDTLYGGEDNDYLQGDEGDDTLYGGVGDDTMRGGADADTFVFAAGHGNDTIKDFTDGEDLIDLSQISGIAGFEDLTITADGDAAVIDLTAHGGGTIRLADFDVANLDAEDFAFYEPPVDPGVDGI